MKEEQRKDKKHDSDRTEKATGRGVNTQSKDEMKNDICKYKEQKNNKEYELLKSEIMQKMQMQNVLITSMVAAVVAVLAFIFKEENINWWMFILPQMIIVPICMRYGYNRSTIAKISAYMIVFLENKSEFSWEINNEKLENIEKKSHPILRNSEFVMISIVCTLLTHYYCFKTNNVLNGEVCIITLPLYTWIVLGLSTICTFVVLKITFETANISSNRNKYKEKWKQI